MGRIRFYTKLAFSYRMPDGDLKTAFVGEDTSGANLKPWAVFISNHTAGATYQISKWYFHRGWAERKLRKFRAEYQVK